MALNSLLDIPLELISSILLYLSPHDIISCGGTCRALYDLCGDTALRYLVQMERSGVSDDLFRGLSFPERLSLLKKREEAWMVLDFQKTVQISVPFDSTGIYDFTGGAFLLGTRLYNASRRPTVGYSYVPLPSLSEAQDQKLKWVGTSLESQVLDVGLAVHEHDLIAALIAKADTDNPVDRNLTLQIRLLRFSTGQPHPLAEQPIIYIATKSLLLGHCNVLIEIVGDFLALLITFPWARSESEDMFFLVRWKKGEAHCLRSFEWGAYAYFSFLSHDTLVIPNLIHNMLEVVRIVVDEDDNIPLLVPLLSRRTESLRLRSDAIVLFNLLIEDARLHPGQLHFPETRPFTFIVHRRALIAHVPPAQRACAPFRSIKPAPPPVKVPWSGWGVVATRWFEGDPASMRWITTTAGQRAVTMDEGGPTPIRVRDFNPYTVRAVRQCRDVEGEPGDWEELLPNGNWQILRVEESVLPAGAMFKEDVRSALPYVETVTRERYRYEGVLIDEERILGLKTSHEDEIGISSFDVHVLG
ncbi:hypothetical protein B0F90DRAFT_1821617 [Multifurca ochricompacta]|uniref:F-box domain-containing protein n=1 Tax=Multifurca ochricompacta TaxID=376703 RepID=A0AAD4LYZ2_9AGAM|nr:hypothetical protein B0F90DRAFT_1821617 [Multifurca ochricompacta]